MIGLLTRVATFTGILVGVALGAQETRRPGPPPNVMQAPSGPESGGRVVKHAPYSAQTVTETTQTLADGNRIVQRTEGAVYRDGEGRTRREHGAFGIGPRPTGPAMPGWADDQRSMMSWRAYTMCSTLRRRPRGECRDGTAARALMV